jgi:glutathionyl-hydroquinone reductase
VGQKNQTIVSNESAEIIRMFNTAFDAHGARAGITTRLSCAIKLTS